MNQDRKFYSSYKISDLQRTCITCDMATCTLCHDSGDKVNVNRKYFSASLNVGGGSINIGLWLCLSATPVG